MPRVIPHVRTLAVCLPVVTVLLPVLLLTTGRAAERKEAPEQAPGQAPPKIEGDYDCVGTNPNGTEYRGTVRITKAGDVYRLSWRLPRNEGYEGIGLLSGDVLSVGWQAANTAGVLSYRIEEKDKAVRLVGKWTVLGGDGQVMEETLTPAAR